MLLPHILIFISVWGTYKSADLVNDHQWKDVLPYLNVKYLQETRPSVLATVNNTLCAQHFQIYMDQLNTSYWAMLSKYIYSFYLNIMVHTCPVKSHEKNNTRFLN
jgi:hypothetical protein